VSIDDLHWADQMTIDFLDYAGHRLGSLPILLLGTVRPEEVDPPSQLRRSLADLDYAGLLHRVRLRPLTREAVTHFVVEASPASTNVDGIARHLYRETQGHPLYLVSLLADLFEDGVFFVDADGRWDYERSRLEQSSATTSVPAKVIDVIQSRVGRLEARAQQVLALAAVVGRPFRLELIQRASDDQEEALVDAIGQALDRRLLRLAYSPSGDRYELAHDLVRRAIYQTMLPDRRVLFHGRILAALEQMRSLPAAELAGELAHHAYEGRLWESAIRYCTRAASVALDRFALHETVRQCERGLAALDALGPEEALADGVQRAAWRYDLVATLQLATHLLGRRDQGLLEQLLDLARQTKDRERLARAYYAVMRHQIDTVQNQSALRLVPEYTVVVDEGVSSPLAIGFHQRVGFLYYRTGDLDRALAHHDEALRLARAANDPHEEAVVRNTRGTVLKCLGRYQEAIDDFSLAATLWNTPDKRLQHAFALDNRGDVLFCLGCYAESLQTQEAALPVYREFAYPIAEAECLADLGACLYALGRAGEASDYLQQALALSQSIRDGHDLVRSLNGLARLYLEQDDSAGWPLAAQYAGRAVTEAEQADLPHGLIQALAYQAAALARLGKTDAALELSGRAVALLIARKHIEGAEEEVYFLHSQVLTAAGRAAEAQAALRLACEAVTTKAGWLTDPALRRCYLEQTPVNRALAAARLDLSAEVPPAV